MRIALAIGVSEYIHESRLPACKNDVDLVKDVFERLNKFDEICVVSDSPKGTDAKRRITDFINKYRGQEVNEFVFYYSGHGARYDDEFFYIFSDYTAERREGTSLRNSELDGLIRNLSPGLTVKIIDACYAGSMYIKSDTDVEAVLTKSAKDNRLSKVYFMHSSADSEPSYASAEYSYFTLGFFDALIQTDGPLRYRDIMAFVADNMSAYSGSKPTFVSQGDNTEIFAQIEPGLVDFMKSRIHKDAEVVALADGSVDNLSAETALTALVRRKSTSEYATEEEVNAVLTAVKEKFDSHPWPDAVKELFDVDINYVGRIDETSNTKAIGEWLRKNTEENYLARPEARNENYDVEEYKELPKKRGSGAFSGIATFFDDRNYRLETVTKSREVLVGFSYKADAPLKIVRIYFKPKPEYTALENYCLTIVFIASRKSIVMFYSHEHLPYQNWEAVSAPVTRAWKLKTSPAKAQSEALDAAELLISEAVQFIETDIKTRLGAQ